MNKTIQQRAKDAMKSLYFIPWSKDRIEAEFVKQLTAQQAEDARACKAEVDLIRSIGVSHQNAANELRVKVARLFTERAALARQVEELTKDKVMLDTVCSLSMPMLYVKLRGSGMSSTRSAIASITSRMKGETHE